LLGDGLDRDLAGEALPEFDDLVDGHASASTEQTREETAAALSGHDSGRAAVGEGGLRPSMGRMNAAA
jgi:hypothetical protein